MSHCSFLFNSNSADIKLLESSDEIAEVCKAVIPFLWPAMYRPKHIKAKDLSDDKDRDGEEGQYLAFVALKEEALAIIESRKESIFKVIEENYRDHYHNLTKFLRESSKRYIIVRIDDIEQMGNESMVDGGKSWERVLNSLDKPITKIRSNFLRYFLGSGISNGWQVLLTCAGMGEGLLSVKVVNPPEDKQFIISGALSAEEILSWASK